MGKPKRNKKGQFSGWKSRSKKPWETGRGAPRKGNPRFRLVYVRDKNGILRKVYVLRRRKRR